MTHAATWNLRVFWEQAHTISYEPNSVLNGVGLYGGEGERKTKRETDIL